MNIEEEKRGSVRITYVRPVIYNALGQSGHPPNHDTFLGEGLDLSNGGMRIRMEGRVLPEGSVVRARIAVSEPGVTVPVLTQVRWVKEEQPGAYQIGLRFVL